jgi:hypothetical protein
MGGEKMSKKVSIWYEVDKLDIDQTDLESVDVTLPEGVIRGEAMTYRAQKFSMSISRTAVPKTDGSWCNCTTLPSVNHRIVGCVYYKRRERTYHGLE